MPIADALGAVLAHSLQTEAGVIKKGRALSAAEVDALRAAGHTTVMAARLDADDTPEDAAARQIAQALAGAHVTVSSPFTGRCNIFAGSDGIASLDLTNLDALNALDERITIATIAPFERVTTSQMLATIKIIPFAVPNSVMRAAVAMLKAVPDKAIGVTPFVKTQAALVLTKLPATKASILDKRTRVIADRLKTRGATLAHSCIVSHDTHHVATAIANAVAAGHDPVLVFSASAIVDRGDVVPAALVESGGMITRLGMPVDPGNLLLLGRHGATTVIGIPSCAASPKLNGFDWVLDRALADLDISPRDIARMGVGGLLKEIPTRPQPRDIPPEDAGRRAPKLACLILAAGRSTRMGANNKLLEDFAGMPIVRHVVEAACASSAATVIVVTGHQGQAVRTALTGLDVNFTDNTDYASGLASSLRAGLAALPSDIDGVFVALGDMPEIKADHLNRLAAAFAPKENRAIVAPIRHGKRGNPVLWGAQFFNEMRAATGDTGAKHLIGQYADQVAEVDLSTDAVLTDIDTPDALAALRARPRSATGTS
jgi:molybdenum cofactor cytidylyltransferase